MRSEVSHARTIAYRAAIEAISDDSSEETEVLRMQYGAGLMRAESDPDGGISGELPADPMRRRAIFALRESSVIGDDAFHLLEEEFDWAELSAQPGA